MKIKKDEFVDLSEERSDEIAELKGNNKELQSKVDSALPWFEMEEERIAEEERIKKENIQKTEEEVQRVEKEKVEQEELKKLKKKHKSMKK